MTEWHTFLCVAGPTIGPVLKRAALPQTYRCLIFIFSSPTNRLTRYQSQLLPGILLWWVNYYAACLVQGSCGICCPSALSRLFVYLLTGCPYKAQNLSRSLFLFHFLQLSSRKKTTSYKLSSSSSSQRDQITNHHGLLHPNPNPTSHLPLHKHTPLPTIHNATRRQKTSRHRRQTSHKHRPPLDGLPPKGPSGKTPERCRWWPVRSITMGSKAVKSMNFLISSFFFSLSFRFGFLVACNWRTLENKRKEGFWIWLFCLSRVNWGCHVLIVGDTDRTMRPMSRRRMISWALVPRNWATWRASASRSKSSSFDVI